MPDVEVHMKRWSRYKGFTVKRLIKELKRRTKNISADGVSFESEVVFTHHNVNPRNRKGEPQPVIRVLAFSKGKINAIRMALEGIGIDVEYVQTYGFDPAEGLKPYLGK